MIKNILICSVSGESCMHATQNNGGEGSGFLAAILTCTVQETTPHRCISLGAWLCRKRIFLALFSHFLALCISCFAYENWSKPSKTETLHIYYAHM